MIIFKNINETLSLFTLILVLFITIKQAMGIMFSHRHTATIKGNLQLFKEYINNTEE